MLDNARVIFDSILAGGYESIRKFYMDEPQEENLFIDFKSKANPTEPGAEKGDREKFSKAISGFANSCGGVIVWGIDCRSQGKDLPDIACGEAPISN